MKAYKGFKVENGKLICRDFVFKEGKTYETTEAKLCKKGFHACLDPIGCLAYYPPSTSEYHEVELEDISDEIGEDSKIVGKKITIGKKMSIEDIRREHLLYLKNNKKDIYSYGNIEQLLDNAPPTNIPDHSYFSSKPKIHYLNVRNNSIVEAERIDFISMHNQNSIHTHLSSRSHINAGSCNLIEIGDWSHIDMEYNSIVLCRNFNSISCKSDNIIIAGSGTRIYGGSTSKIATDFQAVIQMCSENIIQADDYSYVEVNEKNKISAGKSCTIKGWWDNEFRGGINTIFTVHYGDKRYIAIVDNETIKENVWYAFDTKTKKFIKLDERKQKENNKIFKDSLLNHDIEYTFG